MLSLLRPLALNRFEDRNRRRQELLQARVRRQNDRGAQLSMHISTGRLRGRSCRRSSESNRIPPTMSRRELPEIVRTLIDRATAWRGGGLFRNPSTTGPPGEHGRVRGTSAVRPVTSLANRWKEIFNYFAAVGDLDGPGNLSARSLAPAEFVGTENGCSMSTTVAVDGSAPSPCRRVQ